MWKLRLRYWIEDRLGIERCLRIRHWFEKRTKSKAFLQIRYWMEGRKRGLKALSLALLFCALILILYIVNLQDKVYIVPTEIINSGDIGEKTEEHFTYEYFGLKETTYSDACFGSDASYADTEPIRRVLEHKDYEDSMKALIVRTYAMIAINHDYTTVYGRMPIEDYLAQFCDTVERYLDRAILVEDDWDDKAYEKQLKAMGEVFLCENGDTIIMLSTWIDDQEAIFAHALAKLRLDNLVAEGSQLPLEIYHGYGAEAELYAYNWGCKSARIFAEQGMQIKARLSMNRRGNLKFNTSYPLYRNLMRHITALTSMEEAEKLLIQEGDFYENLADLLKKEFEPASVDAFMAATAQILPYMEKDRLNVGYYLSEEEAETVFNAFLHFESTVNDLLVQRIQGTTAETFAEIKESCGDYYQNIMFVCIDNRVDLTARNYWKCVVAALMEKEASLES